MRSPFDLLARIARCVTALMLVCGLALTTGALPRVSAIHAFDVPATFEVIKTSVSSPDGALWFLSSTNGGGKQINRITPAGAMSQYPVPPESLATDGSVTGNLAIAPDGTPWFVLGGRAQREGGGTTPKGIYGSVAPDGTIITHDLRLDGKYADLSLAVAPNGIIWISDVAAKKVRKIMPDGTISTYAVTGYPRYIIIGPGGAPWFAIFGESEDVGCCSRGTNLLGTIAPDGSVATIKLVTAPPGGNPAVSDRFVIGPDGNFWSAFNVSDHYGNGTSFIVTFTPTGVAKTYDPHATKGQVGGLPLPPAEQEGYVEGLIVGPDGNLWYRVIGRARTTIHAITTAGAIADADYHGPSATPLARGPGRSIWVAQGSESGGGIRLWQLESATTSPPVTSATGGTSPASSVSGTVSPLSFIRRLGDG